MFEGWEPSSRISYSRSALWASVRSPEIALPKAVTHDAVDTGSLLKELPVGGYFHQELVSRRRKRITNIKPAVAVRLNIWREVKRRLKVRTWSFASFTMRFPPADVRCGYLTAFISASNNASALRNGRHQVSPRNLAGIAHELNAHLISSISILINSSSTGRLRIQASDSVASLTRP